MAVSVFFPSDVDGEVETASGICLLVLNSLFERNWTTELEFEQMSMPLEQWLDGVHNEQ